tara:strand:+ start:367 stop:603 length:237 start_codon:yes stop_codon:yes gene_type:complete
MYVGSFFPLSGLGLFDGLFDGDSSSGGLLGILGLDEMVEELKQGVSLSSVCSSSICSCIFCLIITLMILPMIIKLIQN